MILWYRSSSNPRDHVIRNEIRMSNNDSQQIANREWPGLTKQGELFVDAVHPSAPMEALNTYMHFAALYGRSPVGLPMPSMLKNARREAWDERFNRLLQQLAWETVTKYQYSLVTVVKEKSL
jgi:hypothetical protein